MTTPAWPRVPGTGPGEKDHEYPATTMGRAVTGLVTTITIVSGGPGTSVRWTYTTEDAVSSPAAAGGAAGP
jgi:hypothetical protein